MLSRITGSLPLMLSYCFCLMLLSIIVAVTVAVAAEELPPAPTTFKTLNGNAPLVIAKGGFSGVFPDSSEYAFAFASSFHTSLWCDVQLTKDGVGICLRDLLMQNCTDITEIYPEGMKTYLINGAQKTGWLPVDYNMSSLRNVTLTQSIYSRTQRFDYSNFDILSVTGFISLIKPSSTWLNVEHDIFYREHGLNMTNYILSIQKLGSVKYISSPELGFLQSLSGGINREVNLVFRFLDKALSDPSTNKTYNSMLSNLTFIKTIASGIMVSKNYIWPVTSDNYIQLHTQIVQEAHNAGLEIYASDFSNDGIFPYNYSYDPLGEYLSFVSDGGFSVDGVLTDFPLTASEAIDCFSNLNTSRKMDHGNPLIISHNGGSGDYPGCTDLAYENAVRDGADVIDCSIQMTKDGIPICMSSIDLLATTDVQQSKFCSLLSVIPEIQTKRGIFTFNLTWDEINILRRTYTNHGKFLKLSEFLTYAKDKELSGIMITIENAAFMAASLGFDVVDLVSTALSHAGYNNPTTTNKEVMIQSRHSAVLVKLKQQKTQYKLVYTLPLNIEDASDSSVAEINKFADAVIVDRKSVFVESSGFIVRKTNLVKELQSAGRLAVYAQVFRNEFVSSPWDFFSDETVEINNYVLLVHIDGIITDFPKTVRRYKMNPCTGLGDGKPRSMKAVEIGGLVQKLQDKARPPARAPALVLKPSDVVEPPLPAAAAAAAAAAVPKTTGYSSPRSDAPPAAAVTAISSTGILLGMVWVPLLI
ncbi:glycerophosphodiester phosphodiesterase GDPDL4-like isoform X2 [Oryza glaberrima]|uniref:glycerophosphodiester phosphodiesterase GDPDL4-like isoform X2 n=1 Tax=Oryza glaberrima TaxID=4538 RepID=UPI00224C1DCB|nr:glycerophosphodiester phosphodiesterase GDPDL4-like isoform X2 [Oryza glaberrima]